MVSVCIPVFNGARYIGETLESLVSQTYKDFEVIVSDNASTDGTADVVSRFKARFPRIRYSRNDRNLGYCANVAKTVSLASSEYIAIYHADDVYRPEMLENETRLLERTPEVAGVFTWLSYYKGLDGEDEEILLPTSVNEFVPYDKEYGAYVGTLLEYSNPLLRHGNFFACPSFMTRKSIFTAMGGFMPNYPTSEDLHLWMKYLLAGYSLAIIDKPYLRYRISETQGSAQLSKHVDQSISFSVMDDLLIERHGYNQLSWNMYKERKAKDLLDAAVNSLLLGRIGDAWKHVKESKSICTFHGFSKRALMQHFPVLGLSVAAVRSVILARRSSMR